MPVLLVRHVGEDLGGVGEVGPQALGEVGVDAAVLFLVADGESEDFAFGEFIQCAHDGDMRQVAVSGKSK